MSRGTVRLLANAIGDGAALASSTTPTSLLPAHAKYTFPWSSTTHYHWAIGDQLRVRAAGRVSNKNPTPGTLTLEVRLGTNAIWSSGAMALNTAAAKTNVSWMLDVDLTFRTVGATTVTTVFAIGQFVSEAVALAATGVGTILGAASAPAASSGFDATASAQATLDLYATFNTSDAANAMTLHQFTLEQMNW
jgi:hypothetical protein